MEPTIVPERAHCVDSRKFCPRRVTIPPVVETTLGASASRTTGTRTVTGFSWTKAFDIESRSWTFIGETCKGLGTVHETAELLRKTASESTPADSHRREEEKLPPKIVRVTRPEPATTTPGVTWEIENDPTNSIVNGVGAKSAWLTDSSRENDPVLLGKVSKGQASTDAEIKTADTVWTSRRQETSSVPVKPVTEQTTCPGRPATKRLGDKRDPKTSGAEYLNDNEDELMIDGATRSEIARVVGELRRGATHSRAVEETLVGATAVAPNKQCMLEETLRFEP